MKPILLIDFGSTYTKLTAVDVEAPRVLGSAMSYTTVQTDINDGLRSGLALLEERCGRLDFAETYACSSAAGGLRMIGCGLVPELTSEAAKLACLGAGAKIVKLYSYQLTEDDAEEIQRLAPDIFLLAGGTDGGNTECILHNAGVLADMPSAFPIIIAGNRTAARECQRILAGHDTILCDNVMPKLGVIRIEPVQEQIRSIFLKRIIHAKGLSQAASLLSDIVMPTPAAVLQGLELLADGCGGCEGIGELVAVDVGGATTDVYSIAEGCPDHMNTVVKGLPEPRTKRSVEGDIGMRYGLDGIIAAAGLTQVAKLAGLSCDKVEEYADFLRHHTDALPEDNEELQRLDFALACYAAEIAVTRHAGTIEETYTLMGTTYVQTGKNLTGVNKIVVTGGSLITSPRVVEIVSHTLYNANKPMSLRPKRAEVWVDRKYILAAMGLLSTKYPQAALKILKLEMEVNGY